MSAEEFMPETQAAGDLTPPPRQPPTAVATSAPLPEPVSGPVRWLPQRRAGLVGVVDRALDVLDTLGDRIREVITR
jgi:hypothetical protein